MNQMKEMKSSSERFMKIARGVVVGEATNLPEKPSSAMKVGDAGEAVIATHLTGTNN